MRLTWKQLALRLIALASLSLFFAGAAGTNSAGCTTGPSQDGHAGNVYVMVVLGADVTSVNVSGFGVPASPAQFTEHFVNNELAAVTWTSGSNYTATVHLPADSGKEAKCEDHLFWEECENGEDGSDRTYVLEFSGDRVVKGILIAHKSG